MNESADDNNSNTRPDKTSRRKANKNEDENVGDLLTDVGSTPLITEKQRREDMINSEMEGIFENVQEYLLRHMMDEVFIMDDIKVAYRKSALQLAYRKKYHDFMEDTIVYFPTCKKLILSYKLMEEAEKYYHCGGDDDDVIPAEINKALRAVVSVTGSCKIKDKKGRDKNCNKSKQQKSSRRRKQLQNYSNNNDDDNDDDDEDSIGSKSIDDTSMIGCKEDDSLYDSAVMERLAMSWREAMPDETLENRLALC